MYIKKIAVLLIATTVALSACGQRDESTNDIAPITGFDADGNPTDGSIPDIGAAIGEQFKIRVNSVPASLNTVSFGGLESDNTALIRAVVTNDVNSPQANVPVTFSSTAGILRNAQTETDENGQATAQLSIELDPANQDVVVTVTSGNFSADARVVASGSTIEVAGENNVPLGTSIEVSATLTAGTGDPLSNEEITITSRAGNDVTAETTITDPNGRIAFTLGSDNGADTISLSALVDQSGTASATATYEFTVADDSLRFVEGTPTELPVNVPHPVSVVWNVDGDPVVNEELTFAITSGAVAGGSATLTDEDGRATVNVISSVAGEVVLYVESADGSVVNRHDFEFVGVDPAEVVISSTSTRVTARETAVISVRVQDAFGNPVRNTPIVFSSANLQGGQISAASAVTSSDGTAEVVFTAGAAATEADEIVIFAEVDGLLISDSVALTVSEPALNITIGTSNDITTTAAGTQYRIPYVVQIADGGGQPLEGAEVHISLFAEGYAKGQAVLVDEKGRAFVDVPASEDFEADYWSIFRGTTVVCNNEDINGNRITDAGEDINGNGALDPQDPALIAPDSELLPTIDTQGVLTTDETGFGYFNLVYPASAAGWSRISVVARAQALSVESEATYSTDLLTLAAEQEDTDSGPANQFSPYGAIASCSNPN